MTPAESLQLAARLSDIEDRLGAAVRRLQQSRGDAIVESMLTTCAADIGKEADALRRRAESEQVTA